MNAIEHRTLTVNGLSMHIAEAGRGPLVVLLHGFPEVWYSWRHQLPALAAAGYHAVAPDVRAHGRTDSPARIEDHGMLEHVADVIALLDALDAPNVVLIGHDWGANTAWAAAELHPERIRAIAALSVPYRPRPADPPIVELRRWSGNRFNWMLHFQQLGIADAELAADPARTLRLILTALAGEAGELGTHLLTELPRGADLLDAIPEPAALPPWLSAADLAYYVDEYRRTGFTGGLNRYRNADRDWHRVPHLGTTVLHQPALFIGGAYDSAVRFANHTASKHYVPNQAEPVILPGCGHWIQQERPTAVNDAILAFLASLRN
ncbi:alpha/beta fold hydrolase [Nocardia anaemiae]|uniref:alpha/beta fold hydrolase n=1 Tax=Nocardia anaemiae TaxID=263910 RepID=UPI0007A4C501|nr:alpha/beta hydrolase [Nocardia anaemiae]